jgi:hypothetical protein
LPAAVSASGTRPRGAWKWKIRVIHPIGLLSAFVYPRRVRNKLGRVRISSPGASRARRIRDLKLCISDLRSLSSEAASIQTILSVNPPNAIVRELCARFRVLQARFSARYREAKSLAVSAIGSLGMSRPSA